MTAEIEGRKALVDFARRHYRAHSAAENKRPADDPSLKWSAAMLSVAVGALAEFLVATGELAGLDEDEAYENARELVTGETRADS